MAPHFIYFNCNNTFCLFRSLWDTFDRCQGDDEALDNNNAFLAPYRYIQL